MEIPQYAFRASSGKLHGATFSKLDVEEIPEGVRRDGGRLATAIVLAYSAEAAAEYARRHSDCVEVVQYADPRALRRLLEGVVQQGMRFICSPVAGEDRSTVRTIKEVIEILRRHEKN
jgi:hypothetical protein